MFEGLVKRLLDTYLAPYVDGITQNLQLAVWSGNIALENLTLKKDISHILALPFHAVSGKIGRISVKIPWATLGITPIKIVIDSVYISIDNRTNEKTDEDILAYISLFEQEYLEYAKAQEKVNPSYLIRLSQKILNNIKIDLTDIHLRLYDEYSSFHLVIQSISVRKSTGDEGIQNLRVDTGNEIKVEPITHVCSLLGFSIHEGDTEDEGSDEVSDGSLKGSDGSSIMGMMEDGAKDMLDVTSSGMRSSTGPQVEPAADLREAEGEVIKEADGRTDLKCNGEWNVGNEGEGEVDTSDEQQSTSNIYTSSSYQPDIKIPPWNKTLLEPSSFRLMLAVNARNKSIYSSLFIGSSDNDDILRIVLSMDSIRSFTKIWISMKIEAERAKRLILQKSSTVLCDTENIKGKTKTEFISLYTKLQNYKNNCGDYFTPYEEERYQTIIDVIHPRHIARWKFACRKRKNIKIEAKQESWFKWIRGIASTVDIKKEEDDDISIENLPGGLILTKEELNIIKETIYLDEQFEDNLINGSYYFECSLPKFQFIIDITNDTLIKMILLY